MVTTEAHYTKTMFIKDTKSIVDDLWRIRERIGGLGLVLDDFEKESGNRETQIRDSLNEARKNTGNTIYKLNNIYFIY